MSPTLSASLLALTLCAAIRPIKTCPSSAPKFTYDASVTLVGTVSQLPARGQAAASDGEAAVPATVLVLDAPISVISEGTALESECDQPQIQLLLAGGDSTSVRGKVGHRLQVTGTLGHAFAPSHQTAIVLKVSSVREPSPPAK